MLGEKMDSSVAYVFDHNNEDKGFDIFIGEKSAYNRPHTVIMHRECR